MVTSIYLSNSNIQIAVGESGKGKGSAHEIYSIEIQEGSILNGVVTSESELLRELKTIWEQFKLTEKDVRLVIDSTQFFTKVATVPKQNEKKTKAFLKNEFSEIEQQDKYLFDYRVLEEKKGTGLVTVVCAATPKEYIETYRSLFMSMGIMLDSIDVALNARLKAFKYVMELEQSTFISLALDGSNLTSTLFVNGEYKYFNRTRIFSESGTSDFGLEVARTVSSIMQFHSSEKYEQAIECVYMGNFSVSEYAACETSIRALGLQAIIPKKKENIQMPDEKGYYVYKELATGKAAIDFIYPMGNLIDMGKDINFIRCYDRSAKERTTYIPWKLFAPAIITFTVCVLAAGGLVGINIRNNSQLRQANSFLKDKDNIKQYEEAMDIEAQILEVQNKLVTVEFAKKVKESFPDANSKVQAGVNSSAGNKVSITIDSFDAVTGVYEFTAMAAQVTDIYDFIDQLRGTELFSDLEYSGYIQSEETQQYEIQVSVQLSENAGK